MRRKTAAISALREPPHVEGALRGSVEGALREPPHMEGALRGEGARRVEGVPRGVEQHVEGALRGSVEGAPRGQGALRGEGALRSEGALRVFSSPRMRALNKEDASPSRNVISIDLTESLEGVPRNTSAAKCLDLENASEEVSRLASFERAASSGAQTTGE